MAEQHPLFPSGEWEGFYTYRQGPAAGRHPMPCQLNFSDGVIRGSGTDNVGGFTWQGSYHTTSLSCTMVKSYTTHQVHYQGQVDENGIWGSWTLSSMSGGFHLWPKKPATETEEAEVEQEELKKLSLQP